ATHVSQPARCATSQARRQWPARSRHNESRSALESLISTRWATEKLSDITISPPFGSRASAANTDSNSALSPTGAAIASTATEAAALKGFSQYSAYVAVAGLNSIATRATRGAISLSSSINLPAIVGSETLKPVTLPPGCGKLATKPLPTGSLTFAKMIGMV